MEELQDFNEEELNENKTTNLQERASDNPKYDIEIETRSINTKEYLGFTAILMFLIFYFAIPDFKHFINKNYEYIDQNPDVFFIFIAVIVVPVSLFIIYLILKLIKNVWRSYSVLKFRIKLTLVRLNFVYFAFIDLLFATFLPYKSSSWQVIVISVSILIFLNYFFLEYEPVIQEQRKIHKMMEDGEEPPLSPSLIFSVPAFLIFVIVYFGNLNFRIAFGRFLENVVGDDTFYYMLFWLFLVFSIFWSAVDYFITIATSYIKSQTNKKKYYIKLAITLGVIYLVVKIVIFNITEDLDAYGSSLTSMGVTALSSFVFKGAKRVLEKRKE